MCLGIPGKIVEIREDAGLPLGVVDFGGVRREVCLAFVADEAKVGDYAVVHVGFAISLVDEEEALRSQALLAEMAQGGDGLPEGRQHPGFGGGTPGEGVT